MSSIFQGLCNSAGRLKTGAAPIAAYFRGLPLNAAGEVVIGPGPVTRFQHGMPYNAAGAIVGILSTAPSDYGSGATPHGPNGELGFSLVATAIANFHQGVPYSAAGEYCPSSVAGLATIVAKDFTLTPAVVSVATAGYRLSPLSGVLAPDGVYAGGNIDLILAQDNDAFYISTANNLPFPGIAGILAVQFGPYIGPNRITMAWDGFDRYTAVEPGIYTYMVSQIGLTTGLRLSGSPP